MNPLFDFLAIMEEPVSVFLIWALILFLLGMARGALMEALEALLAYAAGPDALILFTGDPDNPSDEGDGDLPLWFQSSHKYIRAYIEDEDRRRFARLRFVYLIQKALFWIWAVGGGLGLAFGWIPIDTNDYIVPIFFGALFNLFFWEFFSWLSKRDLQDRKKLWEDGAMPEEIVRNTCLRASQWYWEQMQQWWDKFHRAKSKRHREYLLEKVGETADLLQMHILYSVMIYQDQYPGITLELWGGTAELAKLFQKVYQQIDRDNATLDDPNCEIMSNSRFLIADNPETYCAVKEAYLAASDEKPRRMKRCAVNWALQIGQLYDGIVQRQYIAKHIGIDVLDECSRWYPILLKRLEEIKVIPKELLDEELTGMLRLIERKVRHELGEVATGHETELVPEESGKGWREFWDKLTHEENALITEPDDIKRRGHLIKMMKLAQQMQEQLAEEVSFTIWDYSPWGGYEKVAAEITALYRRMEEYNNQLEYPTEHVTEHCAYGVIDNTALLERSRGIYCSLTEQDKKKRWYSREEFMKEYTVGGWYRINAYEKWARVWEGQIYALSQNIWKTLETAKLCGRDVSVKSRPWIPVLREWLAEFEAVKPEDYWIVWTSQYGSFEVLDIYNQLGDVWGVLERFHGDGTLKPLKYSEKTEISS